MTTFADMTYAEAVRRIGHDAVIRDDPYFGRRGRVKRVIPDEAHGFLVLVLVYRTKRFVCEPWVELDRPPPDARKYWQPGKVEPL